MSRIALWLVLVVLFVAYYVFSSANDAGTNGNSGGLPFPEIVVAVLVGLVVALFAVVLPRRRAARLSNEGVALLSQGRILAALEKFEATRPALNKHSIFFYNVGVTRLSLWQLEEAERELEQARRKRLSGDVSPLAIPHLALAKALQGKAAAAREWLQQAKSLKTDGSATALLATAILACRDQDWSTARATLERPELNSLGGPYRGLHETLRAWCVEQTAGERRHVNAVSLFGETGPDRLRAAWPELVAFVDRASVA